jgi:hypothetical protein
MVMVETFKNQELENVIFDLNSQDEWKEIVAELGLGNQMSFMEKAKSPMPYPHINQSMDNVFKTLCPVEVELSKYTKTPIPLDVLKEIKFCTHENYFDSITIYYDDKSPDPIALGKSKRYQVYYKDSEGDSQSTAYEFTSEKQAREYAELLGGKVTNVFSEINKYLIARWGDELRPMAELKKMATERLVDKYTTEWKLALEDLTKKLNNAEETIKRFLNAEISEWDLRKNL